MPLDNPPTFQQEALAQTRQDLAVLEKVVEQQGKLIADLASEVRELSRKMDDVRMTLTEARGGWRMLMLLGGAGGVMGAAIQWLASHISLKGAP